MHLIQRFHKKTQEESPGTYSCCDVMASFCGAVYILLLRTTHTASAKKMASPKQNDRALSVQRTSELLSKGWKLLNDLCPICISPLMVLLYL